MRLLIEITAAIHVPVQTQHTPMQIDIVPWMTKLRCRHQTPVHQSAQPGQHQTTCFRNLPAARHKTTTMTIDLRLSVGQPRSRVQLNLETCRPLALQGSHACRARILTCAHSVRSYVPCNVLRLVMMSSMTLMTTQLSATMGLRGHGR